MKHLELIAVAVCTILFAGCESTKTAGEGNQEAKRREAIARAQNEQSDEATRNLYNAQQDVANRDGNPGRRY